MTSQRIGPAVPAAARLGLGCMAMSGLYGTSDRAESLATIAAALEAGITLLDTGDFYGMGHNELLIREALRSCPGRPVRLSVKFGALRDPAGRWIGYDARPAALKSALAYSLQRLGVDSIEIYRPARLDPNVPIEQTVGAIAELVEAGYVRRIGLSEVGIETLRRAARVHPICDLQIEYSLFSRGIESGILAACRELGIGFTAYGVLSRGLLARRTAGRAEDAGDMRAHIPRFQPGNLERNLALVQALAGLAEAKRVSTAQLAIAWVCAQGDDIMPLIGARTRAQLCEALAALELELTTADLAAIERAVPPGAVAGGRYAPAQMAMLDSERSP